MVTQTTKVENGTISLPRELRKAWRGAEVFVFPNRETLIIKKVQKPLSKLSNLASRISCSNISQKEIQKEIQAYRKSKRKSK